MKPIRFLLMLTSVFFMSALCYATVEQTDKVLDEITFIDVDVGKVMLAEANITLQDAKLEKTYSVFLNNNDAYMEDAEAQNVDINFDRTIWKPDNVPIELNSRCKKNTTTKKILNRTAGGLAA